MRIGGGLKAHKYLISPANARMNHYESNLSISLICTMQ